MLVFNSARIIFLVTGLTLQYFWCCRNHVIVWNIFDIGRISLDFSILFDRVSTIFFSVLCIIVSCVLKFSTIYMEGEKFLYRFFYIVMAFVLSMTLLIFIPHFFFVLVGWDGLGVTRFLLVIYYLRRRSYASGMKTYLVNRIGDGFFLVCAVYMLREGHWNITGFNSSNNWWMYLIILGCFTKSAQFPFSRWLPAAMAAPTPVSALVHSSTLVTAGIYLLIRFGYMIPKELFIVLGVIGMWTMYSARLAACVEWDAKKIVAYSTLRQLGLMVVAISLKMPKLAFFHLITHALFKAMMFICVGLMMVESHHIQDLRNLRTNNILLKLTLGVRCLSLMGFPFLSGFFSKDYIIEGNMLVFNILFYILLLLSLPLTSFYATRLFINSVNSRKLNVFAYQDYRKNTDIVISLLPLYLGTIFFGNLLTGGIFHSSKMILVGFFDKLIIFRFISMGIILGIIFHHTKLKNSFRWFFSEISFVAPFKGNYWIDSAIVRGSNVFYHLDGGNLEDLINTTHLNLSDRGSFLSKVVNFFLSPKMKYYAGCIFRILIFLLIFI